MKFLSSIYIVQNSNWFLHDMNQHVPLFPDVLVEQLLSPIVHLVHLHHWHPLDGGQLPRSTLEAELFFLKLGPGSQLGSSLIWELELLLNN